MEEKKACGGHILLVPYPSQGHVNPMLQLGKRLASKGLKVTLAITNFISKTMKPKSETVSFDTISDGCDEGGYSEVQSVQAYLERLEMAGTKTLAELIKRQEGLGHPVDCVVYDAFLAWALDVAKQFGLLGVTFFTQACAVNYIYYLVHHGMLSLPLSSVPVCIPGLPLLDPPDMPSFIYVHGSYPAYFEMVLNQFSNVDKADFVLVNTFYKLEKEVVDQMSKTSKLMTVGPTIPSFYLDNRVANDHDYGLHLFHLDPSYTAEWLSNKPPGSVVYVSFGSMANLDQDQMEEVAWGLKRSGCYFLWVVRSTEEAKLPKGFVQEVSDRGFFLKWSPQLEILSNEAVGCFFSHAGWNSTIEALSLGVPMVVMPQWTDQTTDAKFVQDVWKVGIRVKTNETGLVTRDEIARCINEVIRGESRKEIKKNAFKWRQLAKEALSEGGTSDKDIEALVSQLTKSNIS